MFKMSHQKQQQQQQKQQQKQQQQQTQPHPPPLPFNFMEELTRLRAQHTQLRAERAQLLWGTFTTVSPLQLYDEVVVRLPEIRALYSRETLFDTTSLTPMENRLRLIKALSPFVPPDRLFKSLNALWQVMSKIMRGNITNAQQSDHNELNGKIMALEQRLYALDNQNVLLPQLLQMYEHVINTSDSVATMQKSIAAIQNEQVRENMLVLFQSTTPLLETLYLL